MTIRYSDRVGSHVAVATPSRLWTLRRAAAVLAGLLVLALAAAQVAAVEPRFVWTWGLNAEGQLGNNTYDDSNVPVKLSRPGVMTAAGDNHTVSMDSSGFVYAWGSNGYGQLGNGTYNPSLVPVSVVSLWTTASIAAGGESSAALDRDGTILTWGNNWAGQLGDGTYDTATTPVSVVGPTGTGYLDNVQAVDCGSWSMMALKTDGTVWAWGYGSDGQLGNGAYDWSTWPVQVSITDVKAIAAGAYHCVAVKNDGTVWTWGFNASGQLGDNSTDSSNVPVQVVGLTNVATVGAGGNHSLAVKEDGTVWAWGANESGQLGDGTTDERHTPVQMLMPVTAETVAGGYQHTIIKAENRWVYACGNNSAGQLGDGTNDDRTTPVRVQDLRKNVMVACGSWHTTVIIEDLITYTLTLTADPSTLGTVAVTPNQTVFNEDDLVTIEAHANLGKYFTGWDGLPSEILSESTSATGSVIQFNIHEDLDITANFEPEMVWFTYEAGPGGTINCYTEQGRHELTDPGMWISMSCRPNRGYNLLMWTMNGQFYSTDNSIAFQLTQDTHMEAFFGLQRSVTVSASPPEGGSVTKIPSKSYYTDGEMITLLATANPGYAFGSWDGLPAGEISGLSSGDGSAISFYVSDNHVITANFVSSTVHLTYGDHTGGEITGDAEGDYPLNTTVNLHASAHANYRFVRWLVNGDDAGTDPDLELVLDENKTVAAVFVYQYTLTVINGTGSGVYDDGAVIQIVADYPPAEFDQWTGDVATVDDIYSATTTIEVTGDYTVTATPSQVAPLEIAVATEDDLDWVYQNIPVSIANGGHCVWLEVTVVEWGGNNSVTVQVAKEPDSGPGEVTIEDDDVDPMIKWIVGPMRNGGEVGTGSLVLTVTATGDVQGEDVVQVPFNVHILGDINGDGGAQPDDTSLLLKKLNSVPDDPAGFSGYHFKAFDLNADTGIEPADTSVMLAVLNKLL